MGNSILSAAEAQSWGILAMDSGKALQWGSGLGDVGKGVPDRQASACPVH